LLMLLTGLSVAAELAVPKTFVNGEVADADDFNSNNKYLIEKIGEDKARIDELLANARWKNALDHGAIIKKVDCTSNQSALIQAYHANAHEDHIQFKLTGSCFGAYRFVQAINEDGPSEIGQLQPKNQVVGLISEDPANRAKIVPRKLIADREYYVAGLVSSFGNGLYINDIDIEMGADDTWGVLYSRSSNGALTNVKITGAAEPAGGQQGVKIQNGAAAYVGGNDANAIIQNVNEGIKLQSGAMGNFWGTLQINANTGISTFNGGTFTLSLSGDGKITAPMAINLNQGAQGFISNNQDSVSIEGSMDINASSLSIYGSTVLSSDAKINVFNSTLNIWNDNSGMTVDRLNCNGASSVGVNGIALRNDNGNGCLDVTGWKTVIDSAFPVSSGSKAPEPVISSQNRRANSITGPKDSGGGDLNQTTEGLAW